LLCAHGRLAGEPRAWLPEIEQKLCQLLVIR